MNRAAQDGEPPAVNQPRPLGSSRANRDRRANIFHFIFWRLVLLYGAVAVMV